MSRRKQLKQEAAQLRGRIDRDVTIIRQRIIKLMAELRSLARSPVALPVAFISGIVVDRLQIPGIKRLYGLMAGQLKTVQIVSSFIGSLR